MAGQQPNEAEVKAEVGAVGRRIRFTIFGVAQLIVFFFVFRSINSRYPTDEYMHPREYNQNTTDRFREKGLFIGGCIVAYSLWLIGVSFAPLIADVKRVWESNAFVRLFFWLALLVGIMGVMWYVTKDSDSQNSVKPIWMRKPSEVSEEEYKEFYKSLTKDHDDPLGQLHFTAEGEVSFKSILYVPKGLPLDVIQNYGKTGENIKLYAGRVFITDDFPDMLPKYLSFVRGLVDSDLFRWIFYSEHPEEHVLLKVIKKKLVRKVLDMIKKMDEKTYEEFWNEYSTNVKLGIMEDPSNRNRLAKLLRFQNTADPEKPMTLAQYVEQMKEKQEVIYYVAGTSRSELENSPIVEALIKEGYTVLLLTEPIDEYCIQSMLEFENKKFQNVAKEGVKINHGEKAEEALEQLEKTFDPLIEWLRDQGLKNKIEKAVISERSTKSPSTLVAAGEWSCLSGFLNLGQCSTPASSSSANRKKIFEINPRHPIIKELLRRIEADQEDPKAYSTAQLLFETATLRSDDFEDQVGSAHRIEGILRQMLGLSADKPVEEKAVCKDQKAEAEDATAADEGLKVEEEHAKL